MSVHASRGELAEARNPRAAIVDPEVAEELEHLLAERGGAG